VNRRVFWLTVAALVPAGVLLWWLFGRDRAAVTVAGGRPIDDAWDEQEARALAEFAKIADVNASVGKEGVKANAGGVVAGVVK
jgi:hypothetical protein